MVAKSELACVPSCAVDDGSTSKRPAQAGLCFQLPFPLFNFSSLLRPSGLPRRRRLLRLAARLPARLAFRAASLLALRAASQAARGGSEPIAARGLRGGAKSEQG